MLNFRGLAKSNLSGKDSTTLCAVSSHISHSSVVRPLGPIFNVKRRESPCFYRYQEMVRLQINQSTHGCI